jgi:MFS-type transporter involved in bile tolerance (Atg22 family)
MEQLKAIYDNLCEKGIRIPLLRDVVKGTPSISYTMLVVSFCLYIFTMINKLAGWFSNIEGAEQLLIICCGLYFGRSIAGKKSSVKLDDEK